MDLRINFLYRINFAVFLCLTCCYSVASDPVKKNMLDAIVACDSIQFLRNSVYVNDCSTIPYPLQVAEYEPAKDLSFMCKTLQYITKKTCEYLISNKSQIKLPEIAEKFDKEIKELEPTSESRTEFISGWCENSTLFFKASIQNDTNLSYIKYANEILLDKTECIETCQVRHGVNHFCMVFFWFNKMYSTPLLSKNFDASKETAVSRQESLHLSGADHHLGKQDLVINKSEHTIANPKSHKEQSKSSKFLDAAVAVESNNLKPEPVGVAIEQGIPQDVELPELNEKDLQKQDSKLPSSTDDKPNVIDNKIENSKAEFLEGDDDFMAEERKKTGEDGAEGDNDHENMESNKQDPFSDLGDQHSGFESPITKEEDESHFSIYFSIISFVCVTLYIGYHNKQKILAMALEGRQSRRGRSSRRRPNTANYRKLDSNLEEAVTSQCNSNVTHVIY